MNNREFYIETPLGRLRVYAKTKEDYPGNFPGVYIDLVNPNDGESDLLACVEYDSISQRLQTCVYQPGQDEPEAVITHETE